ncbi:MAG: two-component sensor histidine kinase [Rhodospirillaceae bacterium]|nr:two-component sensor histidine kinase [Rhodospirillaceae bacterium]
MTVTNNRLDVPPDPAKTTETALKRHLAGRWFAILLGVLACISVVATYAAIRGMQPFGPDSTWVSRLLVTDLVLLLLLAIFIGWRVARVWTERIRDSAGSRLHVRLVTLFGFISIVPALVVAGAAVLFFKFGVETWFSSEVRTALNQSVAVAEAYLEEHKNNLRADVLAVSKSLNLEANALQGNPKLINYALNIQSSLRGLTEAIVFVSSTGEVIARAGLTYVLEFEGIPPEKFRIARKGEVAILTSKHDDRVRALVRLDNYIDHYLYVGRFVDPKVLAQTKRTRFSVERFENLELKRENIEISFALLFIGLALILLLAASWFGLIVATQFSRPISALIDATERVRSGDLTVRVPEDTETKELGLLSRAFNRMTGEIGRNRGELVEANQQLDERRRFTETVLSGVSAGVIGLDKDGLVNLPNRSASSLTGKNLDQQIGQPLEDVLPEIADMLKEARVASGGRFIERQIRITREREPRTLLVRIGTEREGPDLRGFVVTFDDISALMSAQRKAAWADVARRIAHEIRNPLTPIQLSAERLKRKYADEINSDRETFETCTDTIVRHVGDIGRMVDEFSSFARMPAPAMRPENLSDLVGQSVFLQRNANREISYETELPDDPLWFKCDGRQVGQAVTNLLLNAAEAIEGREDEDAPPGEIKLRLVHADGMVTIEIEDNGKGLPHQQRDRLTEPYFTTRAKGTGLGLAIVRKIMEDHKGTLQLRDGKLGGACVTLQMKGPQLDSNAASEEARESDETPKAERPTLLEQAGE